MTTGEDSTMNGTSILRTHAITASAVALMAAMPAAAKEFRIAVGDGPGGTQEALGQAFVAALEEKSGGEHTGTLFLNGQLGSEEDTMNDMGMGLLDMSILAINNVTPFSPSVGVLTLPYVIQSVEDAETLTQGEIGQELIDNTIRDAGVRILGWAYSGCRVLSNSVRPVETVEDLQGLVIRVPQNAIMIDSYNSWGLNPTPMAWAETFAALQQGVVDGQDNPYMTINAMRFHEVQSYITDWCYVFSIEPITISESLFQGLSEEERQMLIEAGREATEASGRFLRENEARIKEELVEKGMTISEPADEAEFIEAATSEVWPKHLDAIGGVEVLNEALGALGREPYQP
jgi:tripartite ATP-independent transporter DctP family solute receptor